MQHRPTTIHQRRPAAEWDSPFAPIVVRPVGGSVRRQAVAPRTPADVNAPIVRLAAIYRTVGLREDPFPIDPTVGAGDAHLGAVHLVPAIAEQAQSLAAWMRAPGHRGELAVITGPPRSGRSTLLHAAIQRSTLAPSGTPVTVLRPDLEVGHSPLTDGRLLRAIVAAFGVEPAGRSGLDLVHQIRELARELAPVLVLDGADITGSRLDILRSLLVDTNDPTNGSSLRIVVTGAPDLRTRVHRRPSLGERVTFELCLEPLDTATLARFLAQRIAYVALSDEERAGDGSRLPIAFSPDAISLVGEWSGGSVGQAIELAGECLLEAIARGSHHVDRAIAHDVAREFTDRARDLARHQADSPFAVTAVQARLALSFAPDSMGSAPDVQESSQATTSGRGNRRSDR